MSQRLSQALLPKSAQYYPDSNYSDVGNQGNKKALMWALMTALTAGGAFGLGASYKNMIGAGATDKELKNLIPGLAFEENIPYDDAIEKPASAGDMPAWIVPTGATLLGGGLLAASQIRKLLDKFKNSQRDKELAELEIEYNNALSAVRNQKMAADTNFDVNIFIDGISEDYSNFVMNKSAGPVDFISNTYAGGKGLGIAALALIWAMTHGYSYNQFKKRDKNRLKLRAAKKLYARKNLASPVPVQLNANEFGLDTPAESLDMPMINSPLSLESDIYNRAFISPATSPVNPPPLDFSKLTTV